MEQQKYINIADVVNLTGFHDYDIRKLVNDGYLSAHKSRRGRWRLNVDSVEEFFGIKINAPVKVKKKAVSSSPVKPSSQKQPSVPKQPSAPKPSSSKDEWYYVADEEHFTKVFKRMTEVKHCLKIATGDLKNFGVYVEGKTKAMRLCDFFLSLVKRGVRVQIVCMKPFGFYFHTKEHCPQLMENNLFELCLNEHNHMKVFIFDDEVAYFGSANITSAAVGKRDSEKRNHEAGMLVWGPNIIKGPLNHFNSVWNDKTTFKSSWKRFETKAKKFEKLRGL